MSRCLLRTLGLLPSPLPHLLPSLHPLPVLRCSAGPAGPPSICLPLGVTLGFTFGDRSVVFILIQSPDQGVLAAVQRTQVAGGGGAVGGPEGPEELAVLVAGERRSWLLRLHASGAGSAAPA